MPSGADVCDPVMCTQIMSQIQQRLIGMAFSILRNAGVLNSTSKVCYVTHGVTYTYKQ